MLNSLCKIHGKAIYQSRDINAISYWEEYIDSIYYKTTQIVADQQKNTFSVVHLKLSQTLSR